RREMFVVQGPVREVDLERPRKLARPAEQLLVEVVAPTADCLRNHYAGSDGVEQRERVEMTATRDDQHRDQSAGDRTPDRESAFPDLERAGDPTFAPFVSGEQVVNARADDAAHHNGYRDLRDYLGVMSGSSPANVGDLGGHQHADRE